MFFRYKKSNISSIVFLFFLIVSSLQTGCGNNGCRTAEEQYYGGIWEKTQFTTVKPINPNVIKQEYNFGSYTLYNGTTEARAKENLWYELRTQSGQDAIVKAGNRFTMGATDGVMLAGTSQTLSLTMQDYVKLNAGIFSTNKPEKITHTVNNVKPIKIEKTTTYNLDGSTSVDYVYTIKNSDGSKRKIKSSSPTTYADPTCNTSSANKEEKINYIWYFPKKIIFYKWIDAGYNIIDSVVEVDTINNGLKCSVMSQSNVLWYRCTFTYNGVKLQYKRRVTPVVNNTNYAQYEEQVSLDEDELIEKLSKKMDISKSPGNLKNNCDNDDVDCLKNLSSSFSSNANIELTDDERRQYYYLCIVSGKSNQSNASYCSNYSKISHTIYTEEQTSQKSQIMVIFKTYDEIYESGKSTKTYNNQACFQHGENKNRFFSDSTATACSSTSSYQQFCRMAPKNVKYKLHKIKKTTHNWLTDLSGYSEEDRYFCNPTTAEITAATTTGKKLCPKSPSTPYNFNDITTCPRYCTVWQYTDEGEASSAVTTLDQPATVSFIDYQHKLKKEADLRAGANFNDANNTLYYATNNDLISSEKTDTLILSSMGWEDVKFPCIADPQSTDEYGYRRVDTGHMSCCNDFTNRTKSVCNGTGPEQYCMCGDKENGTDCHESLITPILCDKDMVDAGNCFHIYAPGGKEKWSSFCDGYENDMATWNVIQFIHAEEYNENKPAYLANVEAVKQYVSGSTVKTVPTVYPNNDKQYVGLEYGLIPVAGDEIEEIICTDEPFPVEPFTETVIYIEKPDKFDDLDAKMQEQFRNFLINDSCRVSGEYYEYKVDNKLLFSKGEQGIIPVKWTNFPVKAGQSVPITVSTQYPVLVKNNDDKYIEMRDGNGLMVYLDVEDDDGNASGVSMSDAEMWQCNVGMAGSYGYYRPYEYADSAVINERHINTPNNTWWYCDKEEHPMWFSGYDFKNIKTGKPVYMHVYDTSELMKFLPEYSTSSTAIPHENLPVEKVGCNEDGLPTTIVINGVQYEHSDIFGLEYSNNSGVQYIYSDAKGQHLIPINDRSITSKTYEKYAPKMIVVDLVDEELENVQIQADTDKKAYNKLTRTYDKDTSGNILQAYYEFDYLSKHYKLRIEDSAIKKPALCYNDNEVPSAPALSDDKPSVLSKISFDENNKNYILNSSSDGTSEIFTRYGPFSGMHLDTSGLLLPAIYTTEGACLEHFIYDEQDDVKMFLGIEQTRVKRINLSNAWRLEFTSPTAEYNNGEILKSEQSNNSTGTLSSCYNSIEFSGCKQDEIPDILLVDMSKTTNAKKKSISGSAVIYKDENLIQHEQKQYHTINFAPLGWNNYELDITDPIISSRKCGGYSNCSDDETPVIELTVDGKHYRLQDGDTAGGSPVTIGRLKTKTTMAFDIITGGVGYGQGNYTIENYPMDVNAICFTTNTICRSNVLPYIGIDSHKPSFISGEDDHATEKTEYLYSLSKLPYVIACHKSKILDDNGNITQIYTSPYDENNTRTFTSLKSNTGGYVLKTNIYDFITNKYFARCVPSWITPKWMIMQQPNDPSTFYGGYTPVSGTYIAPYGQTWTPEYVKQEYGLESAWRNYGGIVKNTVMTQNCEINTLNTTEYKAKCSPKNVNTFNASFKAKYPKQIIMIKPIVNDPINTSDDECKIEVSGSKNASKNIKMNSPFNFSTDAINSSLLDRYETDGNVSGVQPNKTINGDGKHGKEFFKQSEFQRNMIGAGIMTAEWSALQTSGDLTAIFDKNDQINFNTSGTYYTSGALSNKSQANCVVIDSTEGIEATAAQSAAYLELAAFPISIGFAVSNLSHLATIPMGIAYLEVAAANIGAAIGFWILGATNATPSQGEMQVSRPSESQRSCGIATAFKVVPLPPAVCLKGYTMKCSNERINNRIGTDTTDINTILSYCKSEESVNFRSTRMNIGSCTKTTIDITTKDIISKKAQRYRSIDEKYPNKLVDAVGNWDESENIYEANCGVCVKRKSLYTYNGIHYSIGDLPDLPSSVRTDEHCTNYTDDSGESHTWLTDVKVLTPFDSYTYANKNVIFEAIKNILSNKISACNNGMGYSMSLEEELTLNNVKTAFLKMQIRNLAACVTSIMSVYQTGLTTSNASEECKSEVSGDIENMAVSACNDILAIIKSIDGDEYYSYSFSQNTTSASCKDDKYIRVESENNNKFGSITRYDAEDILSRYGYGELTINEENKSNGITNLTLHIPTTLMGKTFKSAKLGFYFAGTDNDNPLALYKDFRIDNPDDLKRGYIITIGSGLQATKGKYLYYYIQPLNDQGKPDPAYDPNKRFSPSKTDFVADTIATNNLVYSFKDYDVNDTGNISVISPRTGKLWVTILDSKNLARNDKDADGKYITFTDDNKDGSSQVDDSNVLYTNTGFYTVQANIQTTNEDSIDSIVAGDTQSGVNKLLTTLVIMPIKKIFIGDYVCKRCSKKNYKEIQPDLSTLLQEDVKLPCMARSLSSPYEGGYRWPLSSSSVVQCCSDFSNSLITRQFCSESDINNGAICYHIYTPTEKSTNSLSNYHYFCTDTIRDEDSEAYNTVKFIRADTYNAKRGSYRVNEALFQKYIKDHTKIISQKPTCETTPDDTDESAWYTSDYKKVCDYEWEAGILGKVASSFLKIHLLYIAWFVFVVFSVFIIGFQFITGEQKFDFKFMKKYLWRYALIMAFVNPQSLDLYLKLFVKPAFNLAEGLSSFVAGNFSSDKYSAMDPQNFAYSAFGPVDKILKFWINQYTLEKLLAILFSSWTGIVVVILLLLCFIFFMISVIEAVILYVVILIKMSLYLAIGPVVFMLLIHEKTAGKFTDWWKTIAGCIAEQVMMFAGLSCFGTIYYYILKGSMNFIYCWEPVLKIPILDITLFSMWRIAGTMPSHMAELAGTLGDDTATNTKGFNFLTAFMLFIITCMMSKFVEKASTFGAKIFGQKSSMPEQVKQVLGKAKEFIKDAPKKGAGAIKNKITKKSKDGEKRKGAEGKE